MPSRRNPEYLAARLGDNIRRFRESKGWSQEDLADHCGLHRTYVGDIERAKRNISLATLEALADGLGLDPVDLLSKVDST